MLYTYIRFKDSYASAYIHQAAWIHNTNRKEIIYARIAGKPAFVKAIAAGLLRENYVGITDQKQRNPLYLYGIPESRALYFKIGKIGLVTYYSTRLFDPNSSTSYIVGQNKEFIDRTFSALLKRKPILSLDRWNMMKILSDLQLLTELESYNIEAYEVLWETDKINEHISNLVKEKVLTF